MHIYIYIQCKYMCIIHTWHMPNKNSLEAVKKGTAKQSRSNEHDANLLATVVSDIGLQPSIDYATHKAS